MRPLRTISFIIAVTLIVQGQGLFQPAHAGILKSLCEIYFGTEKKSANEEALKNLDSKIWEQLKPQVLSELQLVRAGGAEALQSRLQSLDEQLTGELLRRSGGDVGFHYNLSGGRPHQYLDAGGIRASVGDVAVTVGMTRGASRKQVYFFRLSQMSVRQILDHQNMRVVLRKSRMGDVLVVFDAKHTTLNQMKETGFISDDEDIFFAFDETKRQRGQPMGVPASAFMIPPLSVFDNFKKHVGQRLSWDEATLVAMLYMRAHLFSELN